MATFEGVDTQGQTFQFEAADATAAQGESRLASNSGVRMVNQPAPQTDVQQAFKNAGNANTNADIASVSPSMSAENLGATPVQTQVAPQGVDDIISTLQSSLQQSTIDPRAEKATRAVEEQQIDLMRQLEGEQAFRARAEKQAGIEGFQQQLTDIHNDIMFKSASLRQGLVNEEGRPVAMQFITGRQAQMRRQAAVELEGLNAVFQATQGNLLNAESRVQKAVDLKFQPIRAALETQSALLQINKDRMTRSEKRLAEKKEGQIAALQLQLERASQQESEAKNTVLSALQNGGSPAEAARLLQDPSLTMDKVLSSGLGRFIQDPLERALKSERLKSAQLQNAQMISQSKTGKSGKPLSSTQLQALTFGERMLQSGTVIDEVGEQFTGAFSRISGLGLFPQGFKSDDRQRFEQAQRDFVNAILRRESGAAISPEEFKSASLQYFPQPGDNDAVIIQKKQNRDLVTQGILREAGVDTAPIDAEIADPLGLGISSAVSNSNPLDL